ncbi:uncharacterized protein A1O9_06005 [Exophiala aquamarina CBS 119918]|uniref:PLD phosphodiesterase domain-containing protein n=1 Tax=Exophiala aquamarina CBS 119918 TaxID=1182545 RepID=A0A072PE78_9EURO|nr:uncharacterized protein A1O9_06005 [Exophiala aquamarina CBS 119918]KEF58082.1 hypothetical protein A1O9_06005 [Exophiala aquamarina CBS 119918]
MTRECIDLTSDDDEGLDNRVLPPRNHTSLGSSTASRKKRPEDARPCTQDGGQPREGGLRNISHPRHGLSNNDPILLDEEDEVDAATTTSTTNTLRSTLNSHNRTVRLDGRNDATATSTSGTNRQAHQNNSTLTTNEARSDEGVNDANRINSNSSTAAATPPAPVTPPVTLPSRRRPLPNLGKTVLGPGMPPPLYPDLPNFGGPWLVKDREGDIPPIWVPYRSIPQDMTPLPPEPLLDAEPGPEFDMIESDVDVDADMDMDSEEAEDLKMAIAMSLEDQGALLVSSGSSAARMDVDVDLDIGEYEDEDDEDVRPAFRASQLKRKKRAPPGAEFPMRRMHARPISIDLTRPGHGTATDTESDRDTNAMGASLGPCPRRRSNDLLSTHGQDGTAVRSIEAIESPVRTALGLQTRQTLTSAAGASIRDDRTISASPTTATTTQGQKGPTSEPSELTSFNLLTLNRHAMEAERLMRLKRKREAEAEAEIVVVDGDINRGRVPARSNREGSKTISPSPPPSRRARLGVQGTSLHQPGSAAGVADAKGAAAAAATVPSTSQRVQGSAPTSSNAMYFPTGKVFQTYINGFPSANTITFPQLIGRKESLTGCLLSSFVWDFDWLLPHFATAKTKFQLVMHAKSAAQREALLGDFRGISNVRLCFPPMDSIINCMHSKLMLLFYDASDMDMAVAMSMPSRTISGTSWLAGPRCRIVVPTANLTGADWGVGGVMENTVFLIDLPVKGQPTAAPTDASGEGNEIAFQKSLVAFLQAQTVPEDILEKLDHFDFRNTAEYGFVHTIGGMHGGERWRTTGLGGLCRTVAELGLASSNSPEVHYVTSSVGSLNDEFMSVMYSAAQGDNNGLTGARHRTTGTFQRQLGATKDPIVSTRGLTAAAVTDKWRQRFRFFFPSENTVKASIGGPGAAETICFSDKWWQSSRFPRQNMRDCVSARRGCLMHNKLMFVGYPTPVVRSLKTGKSKSYIGWVYVGSANLSESAWDSAHDILGQTAVVGATIRLERHQADMYTSCRGRLVQDKSTGTPKLNCRNWECGVIVPVEEEGEDMKSSTNSSGEGALVVMGRVVPVPMEHPGKSFEGRKPWLFSEGITR